MEVDVFDVDVGEFGDAEAGAVQGLEYRAVAQPAFVAGLEVERTFDLVPGEEPGKFLFDAGRTDEPGRVGPDRARGREVTEEGADRGQFAGRAATFVAAAQDLAEVVADVGRRNPSERFRVEPVGAEVEELPEVDPVGAHRVRGAAAFLCKRGQEPGPGTFVFARKHG